HRDQTTSPSGVQEPRKDYEIAAAIGLDVTLWGDDPERRTLRHAGLDYAQARSRDRSTRAQLEFDAASRYLTALPAHSPLEITRAEAAQGAQAAEIAERNVKAGLLPEVELLRARVARAERDARLAESESQLERSEDDLKAFLGVALADSLRLVEPPPGLAV